MSSIETILTKSTIIDEKYSVQFFIKKGRHADTYRVKDKAGNTKFLKLFYYAKIHSTQFDSEGNIKEIEFLKQIDHPNIVKFHDSGEWIYNNNRYAYLVLDFISGETLAERMKREHSFDWYYVKQIISSVLNGLKYLHNLTKPVIHNNLNNQNIIMDMSRNVYIPKLIDFAYARNFQNSTKVYYREGLVPYYLAPECFNNVFSPQTDIYSVGALMYHLLFGMPPWFIDISNYNNDREELENAVLNERKKPLKIPNLQSSKEDSDISEFLPIIEKALSQKTEQRFSTVTEMLKAINGQFETKTIKKNNVTRPSAKEQQNKDKSKIGFSQIAGMDTLKEILYNDVIRALEEKELYQEYGLTIPNGMLLYGPPGCGKSFFAEKLSEEVGYNYVEVMPSTLASRYIHGSQEKIGKLFDDARKNAPTIINFDEFDALVPKRDSHAGSHQSGEVNEFLSQLNNCGKDDIFVIASTNQPDLIDSAVLRAGRIDKVIYLPPPDYKARKEMFKLFLEDRPVEKDIDYDKLAKLTENYVSVDIKHFVDEAARESLTKKEKISQETLVYIITKSQPTVSLNDINKYERINEDLKGQKSNVEKAKVGFKIK